MADTPGMGTGLARQAGLRSNDDGKANAGRSAEDRAPYAPPTLTVYGSLVDLTQKRGGPGRDNPHFLRSF
jgi:hypothetical protein